MRIMKDQIKQVAIQHFNKFGYEGLKMAHIATDLGIKKQSLSYHFPTKQHLLKELYAEVVEQEIAYVEYFFEDVRAVQPKEQLYLFLKEMQIRFLKQPNVAFLQITSFMAPFELKSFIDSKLQTYLYVLKRELLSVFKRIESTFTKEKCTLAFLVVYDGLLTKLIYEPTQPFDEVLEATFSIFWNGMDSAVK